MKWILYLFIVANIGFGLWHYRLVSVPALAQKDTDEQALQLILLKEHQERSSQGQNNLAVADQQLMQCYSLGPFKSVKAATGVRAQLVGLGIEAQHRVTKDNSRQGFWVFIPPQPSRKAALEQVARLKENEIKDYFVVATGEFSNSVSLGVFSQTDLAQKRYNDLKTLGFTVRMQKVDLPQREYWLDWPVNRALETAALDTIRAEHPGVGQTQRSCPTQN